MKINSVQGSLRERIQRLRETIPNGEGLTMAEVAEKIGTSEGAARVIVQKEHWHLRNFDAALGRTISLLVNPKDLKKYAAKN